MPPGPAKACLFDTAPPRTGRRGRRAMKGRELGRPAALATDSAWGRTSVYRYGRTETVQLAQVACLWYGSFGNTLGRSGWSANRLDEGLRPGGFTRVVAAVGAARSRLTSLSAMAGSSAPVRVGGGVLAQALEDHGHALTAADTHRFQPHLLVQVPQ